MSINDSSTVVHGSSMCNGTYHIRFHCIAFINGSKILNPKTLCFIKPYTLYALGTKMLSGSFLTLLHPTQGYPTPCCYDCYACYTCDGYHSGSVENDWNLTGNNHRTVVSKQYQTTLLLHAYYWYVFHLFKTQVTISVKVDRGPQN